MIPVAESESQSGVIRRRLPPGRWWMLGILGCLAVAGCFTTAFLLRHVTDGTGYSYDGQWIGKDAPDFTLTNQEGGQTRLSGLRGRAVLMTFGFTHCPNICPTTLANLSAIIQKLPAQLQQRVQVLFISVDPARDTPKALKDYVGFYSRDMMGLTGSDADIAKVARDYGAFYEAQLQQSQVAGNYYTINHSAYVYLIDPQGRYAVLYNNDKLTDHTRMAADIQHILQADSQPGRQ